MNQTKWQNAALVASLPLIIYSVFFVVRILGIQPQVEAEPGDFITASFFLCAAAVSYFTLVAGLFLFSKQSYRSLMWWWLMSLLTVFIGSDEIFMIHEAIGGHFGFKDTYVLFVYMGLLGLLLLARFKSTVSLPAFVYWAIFGFMSVVAIVSDHLYNEGVMVVMGREISYEQLAESFAALFLACAVTCMALRQFRQWMDRQA